MGYQHIELYHSGKDKLDPLLITSVRAGQIDAIIANAAASTNKPKIHKAFMMRFVYGWSLPRIGSEILDCSHNKAKADTDRRFDKLAGMIQQSYSDNEFSLAG